MHAHGIPAYIVGIGNDLSVLRHSRACREMAHFGPVDPGDRLLRDLTGWWEGAGQGGPALIVPFCDVVTEWLARNRDPLERRGLICCVPDPSAIEAVVDKDRSNRIARECGMDVPNWGAAASPKELAALSRNLHFPVIIKPLSFRHTGEAPFKTRRYSDPERLVREGEALIRAGCTLLAQEYVSGEDDHVEVCVFYRTRDRQTLHAYTGIKTRQFQPGAGVMAGGKAVHLPHIIQYTRAFLEKLDYQGHGFIEFKRRQGRSWFIELNPRIGLFYPLTVKAGGDLCWQAWRDLALNDPDRESNGQRKAWYLDGRLYVNLLARHRKEAPVLREFLQLLLLRHPLACALWNWRDPLPWIDYNIWLVGRIMRRLTAKF